ncbi:MAG: hypothetical protein Q7T68_12270 [Sphingopyxis sp.]|nr:hypothetical protein [Sphingopyxis sp.]
MRFIPNKDCNDVRRLYPTHDWNCGSGERWADNLARLDVMLEDFGDAAILAADAQPGEQVLDIGCGSGTSTFVLADKVGGGSRIYRHRHRAL